MKRIYYPVQKVIGLLILVLVFSCTRREDPHARMEYKITGTITNFVIKKESNFLRFYIRIIPDTLQALIIEGEKEHLNKLQINSRNGTLRIADENPWSISSGFRNSITFYWHVPPELALKISADGTPISIESSDTIYNPNLSIRSAKSFGDINLVVSNTTCSITQSSGAAGVAVKGNTMKLIVTCNGAGPMDLLDLKAEQVQVSTEGQNDIYLHAEKELKALIENIGNVYYSGEPEEILRNGNGPGKLISVEQSKY